MASPQPELRLDNTLGALFLGNIGAAIFYGITSVQTYIYFKNCSRDSLSLRNSIWFLWVLDTVHLAFITHALYLYCVSNFANPAFLQGSIWSTSGQAYITCISEFIVRTIFTYRVWSLSCRNGALVTVITLLSLIHLICGIIAAIEIHILGSLVLPKRVKILLDLALLSGVVDDAIIAGSIVLSLFKARTGFRKTDGVVATLMLYAISTCFLTCVWGFICCITHIIWPDNAIWLGLFFLISELSLNALLATLNARPELRDRSYGVTSVELSSGARTRGQRSSSPAFNPSKSSKMVIDVERHIEIS